MNKTVMAVAGLGVIGAAALVASLTWGSADPFLYRDAEAVAKGKRLYSENCAACHGAALEGQPDWKIPGADGTLPAPPHDETGHTWHHADALLFRITKLGTEAVAGQGYVSRMQGFGDRLSDDEIRQILAYIKSTWPPQIIERHDQINAQSR